jgi:hypothetical protein
MDTGMPTTTGDDWISRNSRRSYPIAEWAGALLSNGDPIPASVLADAMVVVARDPAPVEISCASFLPGAVSIELSCGGESIGTATAVIGSTQEGDRVDILSPLGRCSGWVSFGVAVMRPDVLGPIRGVHQLSGCVLESRCLVFSGVPALTSVAGWDGDEGPISGDVVVRAAPGFVVSVSKDENLDSAEVEIGLDDPQGFLPPCLPEFEDPGCACPGAIRTISGVSGDANGNLRIVVISPPGGPQGSVWAHQGRNSISLLATIPRKFMCEESPVVPDSFGRLGPDFSSDCPPARSYGLDYSGPECDNPPPVIPAPEIPTP